METEAQKNATKKYRREKMKGLSIRFSERELDLLDFVKAKPNTAGYVKGLIRQAMERERADGIG